MAILMVPNRADRENISNAVTKFVAEVNNFHFLISTMVMIRKIRPRRAKTIEKTTKGFDRYIFSSI
jgi:hypothetical protein